MKKSKTQANDGEEQKRHAADGECKRQASDGVETCRRDTQLMGEANDGEER